MKKVLILVEDFLARNVPLQLVGLILSPFFFYWGSNAPIFFQGITCFLLFALLQSLCGRLFYNHLITYPVFHKKYIQVTLLLLGIALLFLGFVIVSSLEAILFVIFAIDFLVLAALLLGGGRQLPGKYFP